MEDLEVNVNLLKEYLTKDWFKDFSELYLSLKNQEGYYLNPHNFMTFQDIVPFSDDYKNKRKYILFFANTNAQETDIDIINCLVKNQEVSTATQFLKGIAWDCNKSLSQEEYFYHFKPVVDNIILYKNRPMFEALCKNEFFDKEILFRWALKLTFKYGCEHINKTYKLPNSDLIVMDQMLKHYQSISINEQKIFQWNNYLPYFNAIPDGQKLLKEFIINYFENQTPKKTFTNVTINFNLKSLKNKPKLGLKNIYEIKKNKYVFGKMPISIIKINKFLQETDSLSGILLTKFKLENDLIEKNVFKKIKKL